MAEEDNNRDRTVANHDSTAPTEDEPAEGDERELPEDVLEDAEALTHRARETDDDRAAAAYRERRDDRLSTHGFRARVRDDDEREVLVLHPDEWIEDGVVRPDRIEDTDRAVEIPLTGPGDPDDWESVQRRNDEIVAQVREAHGDVHGDNAQALADFMGNHCAKPIDEASAEELTEFRTEYFVRNAWPSESQEEQIDRSVPLVFETIGTRVPEY